MSDFFQIIDKMTRQTDADDLYQIVADKVREYCDINGYDDCIIKFEISYDGVEWEPHTEFVCLDWNEADLFIFYNDWCEGQRYLRNLRIIHLSEVNFTSAFTYFTQEVKV